MWSNFNNTIQSDGGFLNQSTSEGSNEKNSVKRAQNILPIMIKHLDLNDEKNTINGIPQTMVTIVGIVRHVEESTVKISYDIEDETGTITAMKWLEEKSAPESTIEVNTYVRVTGMIRDQNDKRSLLILSIKPIKELAELISHLIEVTYIGLNAKKILNADNSLSMTFSSNNDDTSSNVHCGMTKEQSTVYDIIQSVNTECGIERSEIKERLPRNILSQLDDILDFLTGEGHVYTTTTEDHFKAT